MYSSCHGSSCLAAALLVLVLCALWGEASTTIRPASEGSVNRQPCEQGFGSVQAAEQPGSSAGHAPQTPAQELYSTQSLARRGAPAAGVGPRSDCANLFSLHGPGTCNAVSHHGIQPGYSPAAPITSAGHGATAASAGQPHEPPQAPLRVQEQAPSPTTLLPPLTEEPLAAAASDHQQHTQQQQQQQQQQPQQQQAHVGAAPPPRRLLNLAALGDGAAVLAVNAEARKPERTLDKDEDSFMKNECAASKWIMVELSQLGTVESIRLTNKELYSSRVRHFRVRGRQGHPRRDGPDLAASLASDLWEQLGDFTADNKRGTQTFELTTPKRVRYVLLEFLTHYGSDSMCALNSIEVLGVSAAQELEEALGGLEDEVLAAPAAAVAPISSSTVTAAGASGEALAPSQTQQSHQPQHQQHTHEQQQQHAVEQHSSSSVAADQQREPSLHSLSHATATSIKQRDAPPENGQNSNMQMEPVAVSAIVHDDMTRDPAGAGAATPPPTAGTALLAQPAAPAVHRAPAAACDADSAGGCADSTPGGSMDPVPISKLPVDSPAAPVPPMPHEQQGQHEEQVPGTVHAPKHVAVPGAAADRQTSAAGQVDRDQQSGSNDHVAGHTDKGSHSPEPPLSSAPEGDVQKETGSSMAAHDHMDRQQQQPEQQRPTQPPLPLQQQQLQPGGVMDVPSSTEEPQPASLQSTPPAAPAPPAAAATPSAEQPLSMLNGHGSGKPKQAGNLFDIIKSEMVQLKVEQSKMARRLEAVGQRNEELEVLTAALQQQNQQLQAVVRNLEAGMEEAVRRQLKQQQLLQQQQQQGSGGAGAAAGFGGASGAHVNAAGGRPAGTGAPHLPACCLPEHAHAQLAAIALGFAVAAMLCLGLVVPKGGRGMRVLVALAALANGALATLLVWRASAPSEPLVTPMVPRHRMLSNASWGDAAGRVCAG